MNSDIHVHGHTQYQVHSTIGGMYNRVTNTCNNTHRQRYSVTRLHFHASVDYCLRGCFIQAVRSTADRYAISGTCNANDTVARREMVFDVSHVEPSFLARQNIKRVECVMIDQFARQERLQEPTHSHQTKQQCCLQNPPELPLGSAPVLGKAPNP